MNKKKRRRPRVVANHIKNRVGLVFLVVLGLMFLLIVRILFINRHDGKNYNKTILSQMSYNSQTIQAQRGQIFDRNGTSLAYNKNEYNLIIEPKNIIGENAKDTSNLDATVKALVECYGFDEKELRQKIADNKKSYYLRLEKNLSEKEHQKFLDYQESYEKEETKEQTQAQQESASAQETQEASTNLWQKIKGIFSSGSSDDTTAKKGKILGVYFETVQKRVYPYGTLASTTIGFSDATGGKTGLERQYNSLLKGINGRRYGYLNQDSSVDVQTIEETNGYSVVSTLDSYIQKACEDIINAYEKKTGSNVTSIMVMNPNNGEIYAMAASRQYNLNEPGNLDALYTKKQQKKMSEEEKSEALLKMWQNFCVSNSYEPGSTAKVFTVAAGLEENCFDENSAYVCDGVGVYGGSRIHCHKLSGHGRVTVTGALMASCNDALMQMGAKIGKDIFCAYQEKFNLGQLTGIDLPDELSCSNQIYHADNMTAVDLATNSFGQNYYVTMVQMCAAYSSLVNGGNYYEPHVVKQILDTDGKVVKKIEPKLVRQTVSRKTSEFMKEALFQVVENGTANRVKIEGYEIGAKTGTAEKANKGAANETYTVSLMSVAPAYDPEVVVYAVVDEPNCSKAENTYQAKDLCKAALEKILPYLNIYPSADGEKISTSDGNFTSPEEDELYDDGSSMIEGN